MALYDASKPLRSSAHGTAESLFGRSRAGFLLDERSRQILARRWLADEKATLHELAAEYGVSAERIRQIEASAIGKLKKQLTLP